MKLKYVVFYGSVRSSRQGIKAARFIVKKLKELEWYARALKTAREQDSKNAERSLCEAAQLQLW